MGAAKELPKPLRGIIVPMITPLADRDTLDLPGLQRLIEHILSGGVQGLFILGTTGEGPSLSYRLRFDLIDHVCDQVAGRVPVLVGITDTSCFESVNLATYAGRRGAQAVVLSAPYYYPAGQGELAQYVQHIVSELPLPVFLYNMPSHTKLTFEPDTIRRLVNTPNIVGLKDSSADMIYFHRVRRLAGQRKDWTLLIGPDELLAEAVLSGADGGVCGGANLCPRLFVDLYEAARLHDMATVAKLHDQVMDIHEALYTVARHGASPTAGLKCALSCLEICNDAMAEPFRHFRDADKTIVRERLADLKPALGLAGRKGHAQ